MANKGYDPRYDQGGYDPGYNHRGGAYERDYGVAPPQAGYDPRLQQPPQCTRRERQWDRYANRYVVVDVPC